MKNIVDKTRFIFKEMSPKAHDFALIRQLVGWSNPELSVVEESVNNSLYWITVFDDDVLIATGRVIGDGQMYFYIQDVIVHPDYQNNGLGHKVMTYIERYLAKNCANGATIGLFAAKGKELFYVKYGFTERDGERLGLGMCKFVS